MRHVLRFVALHGLHLMRFMRRRFIAVRLMHVVRLAGVALRFCFSFLFFWNQLHPAFRAIARMIRDHFGVHRACVLLYFPILAYRAGALGRGVLVCLRP